MHTSEVRDPNTIDNIPDEITVPVSELVVDLWRRRRWLVKVIGLGTLVVFGIALLIPNKYTSTAQLMPPDPQTLSSSSFLSALEGAHSIALSQAGVLSAKAPGGTFIGILDSQTVQDDIINRFDLLRVYHCKFYVDARKILTERTTIVEDKKSGIISIAVSDRDRYRARNLAGAYVEELNKLVNSDSTSSARRERIFLEERLKSIKADLDTSSRALSDFSSHNATLDVQRQGEATLEAAGRLQGELISAEAELSALRAMYTDENVRVREAEGRVEVLQRQLEKMSGVGGKSKGTTPQKGELLPSVRELPLLGVTYYDLYRRVTMEESLYETLTKQYELAKVEEAKEIPPVKVLDEPQVPERKSSPDRMYVILSGFLASAFVGISWIIALKLWSIIRRSYAAPVE